MPIAEVELKSSTQPSPPAVAVGPDDLVAPQILPDDEETPPEHEIAAETPMPADGIHPATLEDEEAVDNFILSFFVLVPDPTDQQMHLLAQALGVKPEDLEQRVYQIMGKIATDEDFDTQDA